MRSRVPVRELRPEAAEPEGHRGNRRKQVVVGPRPRQRKEQDRRQNPRKQKQDLPRRPPIPELRGKGGGKKDAPRQGQQEDGGGGREYRVGVGVGRLPASEKPQPVLVDEVEPGELLLPERRDHVPGHRHGVMASVGPDMAQGHGREGLGFGRHSRACQDMLRGDAWTRKCASTSFCC